MMGRKMIELEMFHFVPRAASAASGRQMHRMDALQQGEDETNEHLIVSFALIQPTTHRSLGQ